ncbi:MAG: PIN domain-containing protein [Leptolyngbyaceae bacterium]|nr:PIN domain-containing protein [Leptolyngbyaceae bacterium]
MKCFFDTSLLVAAVLPDHESHAVAVSWLQAALTEKIRGMISAQCLAEFYSVLTRLPLKPKISPIQARQLTEQNLYRLDVQTLQMEDYWRAIARLSNRDLSGGIVFDALLAEVALREGADQLLTFNLKDFRRLGEDIERLLWTPAIFLE